MVLQYKAWTGEARGVSFQATAGKSAYLEERQKSAFITTKDFNFNDVLHQLQKRSTEMSVHGQEAAYKDIQQEYNNALRLRSNTHFLSKKQRCEEEMEAFLKAYQHEFIPPVLRNFMMRRRTSSEIEIAMKDYFEASTKASEICVELLRNIEKTQSNYQSMDCFLESISNDGTAGTSASSPIAPNLFSTTRSDFRHIHNKYSSVFQSIRSSHRKVANKLKVVKAFKKLLKACLVVGPTAARLCPISFKKHTTTRTKKTRSSKTRSLLRLQDQLDATAKGTYVLGKDLDTVSQLVARLSDDIEWENVMAMCCVERASKGSTVMLMVSELKRSYSNSRRLAEELEELVRLCLATVHRARALVIHEICKSIT